MTEDEANMTDKVNPSVAVSNTVPVRRVWIAPILCVESAEGTEATFAGVGGDNAVYS